MRGTWTPLVIDLARTSMLELWRRALCQDASFFKPSLREVSVKWTTHRKSKFLKP